MATEYAIRNKVTGELGPSVGLGDAAKVGALAGLHMAGNAALEVVEREVGEWHPYRETQVSKANSLPWDPATSGGYPRRVDTTP